MLADRAFVFFRPLTLDFADQGSGLALRWDIVSAVE